MISRKAIISFFIVLWLIVFAVHAQAETLEWEHSTWSITTGYTLYYKEVGGTKQFNFSKPIEELQIDETNNIIEWPDFQNEVRLKKNTDYELYLTAYSNDGESSPSNILTDRVAGYKPPDPVLPPVVIVIPEGPVTIRLKK